MNKATGFTLLELLLVLVLIGIGTSLAIVSVDRLAERVQEKRWVDRTQQVLHRLRNKAVLGGTPVQAFVRFAEGTLSSRGQTLLQLPKGFQWQTAAPDAPHGIENVLPLVFFPDGTMQDARFILETPSGLRQEFHLERISGRIERLDLAPAP